MGFYRDGKDFLSVDINTGSCICGSVLLPFKTLILKFNIPTPGRGESENRLYTRKDYNESKEVLSKEKEELIDEIVTSLGGIENIENIDACITRLRVTVKEAQKLQKIRDGRSCRLRE